MKYKAIIFDFDGTLVDSLSVWKYVVKPRFIEKVLPKGTKIEVTDELLEIRMRVLASKINEEYHLNFTDDELESIWMEILNDSFMGHTKLKPGVEEFLDFISKKNFKIAIASNNFTRTIKDYLQMKNILRYFDVILTQTEVSNLKPAPDIYLKTAEKLKCSPSECLVFEDSVEGVLAAQNANMTIYAIKEKYKEEDINQIKLVSQKYFKDFFEAKIVIENEMFCE